ncbi:hypothetical protein [Vitreoscilla stercoraria]|uniref:Uncharacterized protein n=1 Tax=Vitreoscilla stercoraria TaxID=61 RepID=A0ABY4EF62_VITST|nr:hypothetical protein [Vitreoscilla stercoraria]UOO93570.1 hypothetical protein LVJ81_05975 [Vitreoscilla stercoraria]
MTTELFETEKYTFAISYDASDRDLNVHRIDAKTLGKSIESMAILIEKADEIIHGNSNSMHLYVSAPAQPGSLLVEFILEVLNPINAERVLTALQIMAVGAPIGRGVFSALKKINNEEIIEIHTQSNQKQTDIKLANGEVVKLDNDVAQLALSPVIRSNIKQIVSQPLNHRPMASFTILPISSDQKNIDIVKFNNSDIEIISKVKTVITQPIKETFEIISPFDRVDFKGKYGWRVTLNGQSVNVSIEDTYFLKLISSREKAFKKDDLFKITIEKTTHIDGIAEKNVKYKVVHVQEIEK